MVNKGKYCIYDTKKKFESLEKHDLQIQNDKQFKIR